MNLVLSLLVLGGSSIAVWSGITDPEGGTWQGLRNKINGQGNAKHVSSTSATFTQTIGFLFAGPGSLGKPGPAGPVGPTGPGPKLDPTGGESPNPVGAPQFALPEFAPAPGGKRAALVATARTWLGVPYLWGGTTRRGVDCSGLMLNVFRAQGINLPRVSAAQATKGTRVKVGKVGDLVAFGAPVHHIGLCIGGGQMIHAPNSRSVVRIESIAGCARAMRAPVQYRDVVGRG